MANNKKALSDADLAQMIAHANGAAPEPVETMPEEPEAPPEVGAGETFLNKAVGALPLGTLLANALLALKNRDEGVRAVLTPQAVAETEAMGDEVLPTAAEPSFLDTYRDIRDERRARTEAGSEQNPTASKLGTATGILASVLGPLPKVTVAPKLAAGATQATKGAELLARLQSGAATGSAYGALGGATDGDADTSRGEVGKTLGQTLLGALTGGALGLTGAGAAEGLSRTAPKLREVALEQGRRALDPSSSIRAQSMKPTPDAAIEEVLERRLIRPLSTTPKNYERVNAAAEEEGAQLGQIIKDLEANGVDGPEAAELAKKLLAEHKSTYLATGSNKAAANVYRNEARNIEQAATQSLDRDAPRVVGARLKLGQSEAIKRDLQQQARFDRLNAGTKEEALQEVSSMVRQANEDAIARAAKLSPEDSPIRPLAEAFVPQKRAVGNLLGARDLAERGASKFIQKGGPSLTGSILASGAGMDPVSGYLTAMATTGAMNRLPSTVAPEAYALSKALRGQGAAANLARAGEWIATQGPESAQDWADETHQDPEAGRIARLLSELLRRRK